MFWIALIVGLIVGFFIGVLTMHILQIARAVASPFEKED